MTRFSGVVRRWAAATTCALVAFAFVVLGPMPSASAEDVPTTGPGTTSPEPSQEPSPQPDPSPVDPPVVSPIDPVPPVDPVIPPVIDPVQPPGGETPPPGDGASTPPVEQPALPAVPSADNPAPAAPGSSPAKVPVPLQQPNSDGGTSDNEEALPAAPEETTTTPAPSVAPETAKAEAPAALPEPVAKTIDAVVSTASGSPLYVQFITVLVLIGAGIVYFRVLGSKGTRIPSKSGK